MKRIFNYFVFSIVFMLTIASSCNKPRDEQIVLPTGENTMYYYIDGELYIPKGKHIGGVWAPAIGYGLCLDGISFDISTINLLLHFHNGIQETGNIMFNQSHYDMCQVMDNHAFYGQKELGIDGVYHNINYYSHNGSGSVTVTHLSVDKRVFKGTFEITVYHENTDEPIEITEGHFNINLDTLNQ